MMCGMPSILIVLATVVVLVAGDCMKNITMLLSSKPPRSTGGYERVKNPEQDAVVKKIVADSVKWYTDGDTSGDKYYQDDDHYVVFRKSAGGEIAEEYCSQFQIFYRLCDAAGKTMICEDKRRNCTVTAYKLFFTEIATVDYKSLQCPGIEKPEYAATSPPTDVFLG